MWTRCVFFLCFILGGSRSAAAEVEEHVDKAVTDHAHRQEGTERVEDAAEGLEREEISHSVGDAGTSEEGDEDGDGSLIAKAIVHDGDGKDEGDVVLEVVHVDSLGAEDLLGNSLGVGELRHGRLVELGVLWSRGEGVSLAGVTGVERSKEHLQSEDGEADEDDDLVAADGEKRHFFWRLSVCVDDDKQQRR